MTTTNIVIRQESKVIALPAPRESVVGGEVTIRKAMLPPPRGAGGADFMFIDALQKQHSAMVGFMPRGQLETNIAAGNVLIAQNPATTERIGYVIFKDKYFKREDLGIIYQLNIVPHMQRGLVGAALVKAAFESCPWGVKLFCLWCAQDLEANHFWESIGFVPIAFRAGSRGKEHGGKRAGGSRMQIMWQKRIREGDDGPPEGTPYWYPTETTGGAMKENRLVLPIQPGKHWSDDMPFVLPGVPGGMAGGGETAAQLESDASKTKKRGGRQNKDAAGQKAAGKGVVSQAAARPKRGLWFGQSASVVPTALPAEAQREDGAGEKALAMADVGGKPKRERRRNDPKHIRFARELRDRYLDEVNSGRLLPGGGAGGAGAGKYEVSRQIAVAPAVEHVQLLEAA